MRLEKIKTREGVAGHKKVITKRLLLKNLGETVFINNLLEYLYNAKIRYIYIYIYIYIPSFTLAILCFTCLYIVLPAQLCFTAD